MKFSCETIGRDISVDTGIKFKISLLSCPIQSCLHALVFGGKGKGWEDLRLIISCIMEKNCPPKSVELNELGQELGFGG